MDTNKNLRSSSVHRPEKPHTLQDNSKANKKGLGEQLIEWVERVMPNRI